MKFSKMVNISPSATLAMNALALQKKAKGVEVHNLTVGEALLDTHPLVIEAAHEAMRKGETHYTEVPGIAPLREACASWINAACGSSFTKENVLVSCGGKSALQMLCHAFIEPGDEAVMIAPYWVSYASMVQMFGGQAVVVDTSESDSWKINPQVLKQSIHNRTKLLFINNAANPTGVLYSKEELREILTIAKEHDLVVISDEVYSGLVYEGEYISCASFAEFKDRVVVVQSVSKHFAMTGWRVGFALGSSEIIKKLSTIQSQSTSGTSSISQWAALAAITHADTIISPIRNELKKRRDIFVETFNSLFDTTVSIPSAGLYCFISMEHFGITHTDSVEFCMSALEQGNVAMVPGVAFGKEGYVRCSFGAPEQDIVRALQSLHKTGYSSVG